MPTRTAVQAATKHSALEQRAVRIATFRQIRLCRGQKIWHWSHASTQLTLLSFHQVRIVFVSFALAAL